MRLKVSYDRRTDGLFVRLSGEVDLSVEEHLSAVLDQATAGQPPPPVVVVDLRGLRFLDCAGSACCCGPGVSRRAVAAS